MARPKQIDDNVLLGLIKNYINEEFGDSPNKIKIPEIVRYINSHGYPEYQATTLRRTPTAMKYIKQLEEAVKNDAYLTSVSYQTIDAAQLVNANRSKAALIKAITERDTYYKAVADSAVMAFERHNRLLTDFDKATAARKQSEWQVTELEGKLEDSSKEILQLKAELKAYKDIVSTYVYPEIANELLVKEGVIRETASYIDPAALDTEIITSTTGIKRQSKSGSNVIEGLFEFEV